MFIIINRDCSQRISIIIHGKMSKTWPENGWEMKIYWNDTLNCIPNHFEKWNVRVRVWESHWRAAYWKVNAMIVSKGTFFPSIFVVHSPLALISQAFFFLWNFKMYCTNFVWKSSTTTWRSDWFIALNYNTIIIVWHAISGQMKMYHWTLTCN